MTRDRIILGLFILMAVGLFLIDVSLRPSVVLPVLLYALPALIAAYLLSPREVVGVGVFAVVAASASLWFSSMSLWLKVSHLAVVGLIGYLSAMLAAKKRQETLLAEERGRLMVQQTSEKWYRQIVQTAQEGIWIIDGESNTTFVNGAMAEMLGYSVDEMIGAPLFAFVDDEARALAAAYVERRRAGVKESHDFRFRRKDGTDLWAIVSTNPIFDSKGLYAGALGMVADITERKRVEESLAETSQIVQTLIGASPLAILASDLEGNIRMWNRAAERIFGWSEQEVVGRPNPIVPTERRVEYRSIQERLRLGEVFANVETRRRKQDGSLIDISLSTAVLRDGKGEVSGAMAIIADITERKAAEEERERLVAVIEATSDFVAISDVDGRIIYVNRAGRRMLGIGDDGSIGNRLIADNHPAWATALILNDAIPTAVRSGIWTGEAAVLSRDGTETPVSQVILAHKAPEGAIRFLSTIARDISERKQHEEQLAYLATHDYLTGLANRRLLEDAMNRATARARRGVVSALLFMDLDNFKTVNDTLDHAAGDQVLIGLARLLGSQLRTEDLLVRLGGDEFGVLLEGTNVDEARLIAERMCQVVRQFRFVEGDHYFDLGLSVGVAVIDGRLTPLEVLSLADAAMFRAKEQGGHRTVVYST